MARGGQDTKLCPSSSPFLSFSGMSFCRFCFSFFVFMLSLIIFPFSVDHVWGWQPLIILSMVEAHPIGYRKSAGERTGVRSIFKSLQTGFFIAHLCHNPDLCDRSDPCAEIEIFVLVLRF